MAEYIEREAAIKCIEGQCVDGKMWGNDESEGTLIEAYSAIDDLMEIPSADVAPVRHGRWIEPSRLYYGAKQYECSLCCSDTFWNKHSITVKYPHCPNCGATMELED